MKDAIWAFLKQCGGNAPIYGDTEHNHPLVVGIGDGSLDLEKFRYYMRQDYIYLIDYCRVIALAAAKTSDVEDMGWFAKLLDETLNTEMSLHVSFCEDFGISEKELLATLPSPTTQGLYLPPPADRLQGEHRRDFRVPSCRACGVQRDRADVV